MFRGNPRTPGSLSFENVAHILDEDRMSRLKDTWSNPNQTCSPKREPASTITYQQQPSTENDRAQKIRDEWIVLHLSSDEATGLSHEINVLVGLDILSIAENGKVTLADGWERRVPHMVLNEMRDEWGSVTDTHNLFCIHDGIRASLQVKWADEEGFGWRWNSSDENINPGTNEDILFDEEEYQLRKEIFVQNYNDWASEKSGMGEFGV